MIAGAKASGPATAPGGQENQGKALRDRSYARNLGLILTADGDLPGQVKAISCPSLDQVTCLENTQMQMRVILCREKYPGITPK